MKLGSQQISTAIAAGNTVQLGVLDLLEWAFQEERVRLDFDDLGDGKGPACGIEWKLMQMGSVRIEGGGCSAPHPDAEIVASFLASCPNDLGGRSMAIEIADASRSGVHPDWGQGRSARCEPVEWKNNKYGRYARREFWTEAGRWPECRLGANYGYACPVRFYDTNVEIMQRRANYTVWWRALDQLRERLAKNGGLTGFVLTREMPPRAPWKKKNY